MKKQTFNPHAQMSVLDLLQEWPQAIPVFIHYRMACVGCSMSAFETLQDAARIYGVPFETFLADLHHAVETANSPTNEATE